MFLARYLQNSHPCRDSTITSSQYHWCCRCGPNGLPSNRLDGQLLRAEVSVSGVRTGWCQMRPEPQPRAPRPFHGSCECSRPVSGSVATLQKRVEKGFMRTAKALFSWHAITQTSRPVAIPRWPAQSTTVVVGVGSTNGPPAVGVGGRGGQKWVSRVGGASEPGHGGAKCCRSPNQGPRPFPWVV